jgi:Putative Ig domain
MNSTFRCIGGSCKGATCECRIWQKRTSALPLAVIGLLIASLVGCGGGGNSTNNQPLGLSITTNSLPNGTTGTPYQQTLVVTGGTSPYSWSLTSQGALPAGLALNGTGTIAGTPTTAETSNFTVEVTDSSSASANASFSITINSGGLAASPTALTFTTAANQSFTVSGGVGTVTENSNCSQDGVANVAPPSNGVVGTWDVSPLSNGICSINFTDSTNNTVSVNVNVDIQQAGTSTLTIQMEEDSDCNNVTIWFRFFDETNNLVWPAPPNAYYFQNSNQVYAQPISCQTGAKVCYGGSFYTNTEEPEYWGVGINNDESCPNCCYTCETGTTPVNLLSCSGTTAAMRERRLDDPLGRDRLLRPSTGRGPESHAE